MATSKKSKKPVTPEQILAKVQSDHRKLVRGVFRGAGFHRVTGISDKEFTFDNQTTDLDDVFVYENVIILCEYTATKTSNVGPHLKAKKLIFDKILSKPTDFVEFLKVKFADSADKLAPGYHRTKIVVKVLYCSRYEFDGHYKENVPDISYLDYPALRYFVSVVEAIHKSSRFELLHFLGVELKAVGTDGKLTNSTGSTEYHGSILPEAHSNFDDGYKIVSFYADPDALLRRAYVLRADGWRDSLNLY